MSFENEDLGLKQLMISNISPKVSLAFTDFDYDL